MFFISGLLAFKESLWWSWTKNSSRSWCFTISTIVHLAALKPTAQRQFQSTLQATDQTQWECFWHLDQGDFIKNNVKSKTLKKSSIFYPKKIQFFQVHEKFINAVKSEIRTRKLEDPDHRHSIILLSELTFYTQSLLLLNVIPPQKLTRDAMEYIWFDLW